jgi:glutamate-5-semialdehyde dehydrogenase
MSEVASLCRRASVAARAMAMKDRGAKDAALRAVASALRARATDLLAANAVDVEAARARGTSAALVDRLSLDLRRVEQMAAAAEEVASLEDPIGAVLSDVTRPNGVRVRRVRVPLGVVAMIYEARPNVTVEASSLCLKTGNAVVLRGGSEALRSNTAIAAVVGEALASAGLPRDAVVLLPSGDREDVRELIQQDATVDLVIPRGGEALVRFVRENARVPVIAHASGVCHLFVDAGADVEMAIQLAVNGKLQRPGVCNALECILFDAADAARTLPPVAKALLDGGCELRGCPRTVALVPAARPAADDDWGREFLDRIVAIRVVDGLDGALAHVARYGSRHTEAICTRDDSHADRWRREIDAACVAVNVSTRFHDGGELGLGAEIGIATSKLHWRGAMGLESLTTFQWRLDGDGQTRR